jgi:membrane protease YdiL (CAAX protease family)
VSGRLAAWSALVIVFVALAYGSRAAEGDPPTDFLYQYSTAIGGLVQSAVVVALVLWIAQGAERRQLLGLRRPLSIRSAFWLSLAVLVGVYVLTAGAEPFLHAGEEQGYTPRAWDPDRAGAYAANFVVIAAVAPVAEELLFRGLGYSLWARFGHAIAIVVIGISFGLVHGLLEALVVLSVFGAGLAWLRARTGSVYPCIGAHALFNAINLILAVTVTT